MQEYYSDIVYNCEYNGDTTIKIGILFEHKSCKPENEYPQLLKYILSIWDYAIKNKEKRPIIVPVIFYHGEEEWVIKPLYKYFNGVDEVLRKFIPDFSYILTNLNEISDSVILHEMFKSNINKVMALLFKHMKDEEYLKNQMKDIFSIVKEFFPYEKRGVIITFIIYIMSITEIDNDYIKRCLNMISPEGGEIIMTTAMKLRQEGIKQGIEQGIEQDKLETAARMLAKGFSVEDIAEITTLSAEVVKKLRE